MDDEDTKAELPVHIILRASHYAKFKTENKPKNCSGINTIWMDNYVTRKRSGPF